MEEREDFQRVVEYMQAHWPSQAKAEWQVALEEYPALVEKAVTKLSGGATQNAQMIRVAGLSGSGKTTQILPAVEAYCEKKKMKPILLAARIFVEFHPHFREIVDFYGEENLRKMTDEFTTIMLFLTLRKLTSEGYDIVLDVTLLDPKIEGILMKFLEAGKYSLIMLMVATSPTVTEHFLAGREWRHTKETEQEFIRATRLALEFYAEKAPETRIVIWSVYRREPEYDGAVRGCLKVFDELSERTELPKKDDDERREAKIQYLRNLLD